MNDEFLSRYRRPPSREFGDALYRKISQGASQKSRAISLNALSQRLLWSATVLCLVTAGVFIAIPEARAQTGEVIRKIGQMVFTETMPKPVATAAGTPVPTPVWPRSQESMNVAQVQRVVPFSFQVPAWIPEGYVTSNQMTVLRIHSPIDCTQCKDGWVLSMNWVMPVSAPAPTSDYLQHRITLKVFYPWGVYVPADLQTLEELTINDRPTALKGLWGAAPADPRNTNLSKELIWTQKQVQDRVVFELMGSPGVSVEDLIHMAETIP